MIIRLAFQADGKATYAVPAFRGDRYAPVLVRVNSIRPVQFTEEQFKTSLPDIERTVEHGNVTVHLDMSPRIEIYDVLNFIQAQSTIVYEHLCSNITREENKMMKNLMNEVIVLRKQDGTEIREIQANVQRGKIFIADGTVPLEEGDTLIRQLPNGMTESYIVEDRGYYATIGGIQAHYQTKVRREGTTPGGRSPTVWNVSGANARVNINSQDNSTNIITITPQNVIAELRKAIEAKVTGEQKEKLLAKLEEMSEARDRETKLTKYQQFINLAANITTILAPYLRALASWLAL